MTRADGTPVNAVFGFTNMLARFLAGHVGTHLAVVFDAGSTTFRNRIYDQYKAQRPEPPSELVPQFKLVRDATAAFGVACVELDDWEADDLIAAYAKAGVDSGATVTIVSSDKDLMQLVRPGVAMLDPIKQKPIGPDEVMEKFGVTPDKVIDVQALMGDSVDNVPGVPGIGPKNAAELINQYGDLEAVLAAAPSMKPSKRRDNLIAYAEAARVSRRLVRLCDEAPMPLPIEAMVTGPLDRTRLSDWLHGMGFRSTALRLGLAEGPAETGGACRGGTGGGAYGPYETVATEEALAAWVATATRARRVALHVQTDLDPRPWRAALLGVALAVAPGRACYIPLPVGELTEPRLSPDIVLAALAPLLADPSVLKITANAKYARLVLGAAGLPPPEPQDDPTLISFALAAGAHDHGLADLAAAASRPHGQIARPDHRHRAQPPGLCSRAGGPRHRLRRRGGRRDAPPMGGPAAAFAPARSTRAVRADGTPAGAGAGRGRARRHHASMPWSCAACPPISPPAWTPSRNRRTAWPATRSACPAPSSWARCCSTNRACPAASAPRPAAGAPMPACCRPWPIWATNCPAACWSIASCRS